MGLLKKQKPDHNAKITVKVGKMPSISVLTTSAALAVIEINIFNVKNLVKKADYNAKTTDIRKNIYYCS